LAYYQFFNQERIIQEPDRNYNSRLGSIFSTLDYFRALKKHKLEYQEVNNNQLVELIVHYLFEGQSIGWFQGKSEFGPRALGGRSILANPLLETTQKELNLQVKNRESFRPFAPIILKEDFKKYFDQDYDSPHMLFVHKLKEEYRVSSSQNNENWSTQINKIRSPFPAVTHIDYSSRIQTVTQESDALLFNLLTAFKERTGYGILVNTSFNVKDEPIVNSPEDAIKCYLSTKIDVLVLGNYIVKKWSS
jgi:carbamoyltransferase